VTQNKAKDAAPAPIQKEHWLFGAVGLALGLLLGFTVAFQVLRPGAEGSGPPPGTQAGPMEGMQGGPPPWVGHDGSMDMDRVPAEMRQQMEEARAQIESHEKLLEADPDNADLLITVAGLYLDFGMPDQAWSYFERATRAAPDRPDVWELLGDLGLQTGRYEEARAAYEKAVALLPENPDLLNDLATARLHLGDPEGALEVLDEAVAKHPDHVRSHFNRAVVLLFGRRDADAAEAELNVAAGLSPEDDRIPDLRRRIEEFRESGALPE
jgi:tetratricopeptide (TPR) repeat protein